MSMTWAQAFATQARSDLMARDTLLRDTHLAHCHELHFLQMACEKVCKAYLMNQPNQDPMQLQFSHGYIRKTFPIIARQFLAENNSRVPSHLLHAIARLAEKIELLSPAQRAGGSVPSNTEYPWKGPNSICVPCEYDFGLILLNERAGSTLIKCLQFAVDRITYEE